MSRAQGRRLALPLIILIAGAIVDLARPCNAGAYCTGDCDDSGSVTSSEWVDCRGIAFGSRPLSTCQACDCDENGAVSDAEWMRAEQNALNGCSRSECPAATTTPGAQGTRTPTTTATAPSPSRTPTVPRPTATVSPSPTSPAEGTPTRIAGTCVGDCDGSGQVLVNELVLGVNIALERAAVDLCTSFDGNQTTTVSVEELVQGVNNLLRGCP